MPPEKCWRAASKIQRHVEDFAAKTSDQLEIRRRMILKMETADSSPRGRHRVSDLNDSTIVHHGSQLVGAIKTLEVTSTVFDDCALDKLYAFKWSVA